MFSTILSRPSNVCFLSYLSNFSRKLYLSESVILATDFNVRFPLVENPTFSTTFPSTSTLTFLYSFSRGLANILFQSASSIVTLTSMILSPANRDSYAFVTPASAALTTGVFPATPNAVETIARLSVAAMNFLSKFFFFTMCNPP
ncbi:hypothetical protein D3C75_1016890 [compost metagenome]